MYSYGPPHMAEQKQDGQLEHTYSSSVRIRDVALKTCQRRWTIGRSGERGSGISVLAARHDDDDDDNRVHIVFSQNVERHPHYYVEPQKIHLRIFRFTLYLPSWRISKLEISKHWFWQDPAPYFWPMSFNRLFICYWSLTSLFFKNSIYKNCNSCNVYDWSKLLRFCILEWTNLIWKAKLSPKRLT